MDITSTGDGLTIVICCQYYKIHDWMAFASWYSINKNLPDAKVVVLIERTKTTESLFNWTHRFHVKALQHQPSHLDSLSIAAINNLIDSNTICMKINPTVMAVREYEDLDCGIADVKLDIPATFVDYSNGCGKFVIDEWIDKGSSPLDRATKRFVKEKMSINELKVLKLWEQAYPLQLF